MTRRTTIRSILTLCMFMLILSIASISRPVVAQTCDTVTDQQILTQIYDKIKGDKTLASQVKHINVVVSNKAVKLQGWVNSQKDYNRLVSFATNTSCVRVVNVNDLSPTAPATNLKMGGCASGMKACGDICIPEGDSCYDSPN